jgi:cytoplasmic iron level regulating protein YaaA (DUF328/UPF0246 family)
MLVLLPPSEGKSQPETGEPVDLGSLAFAEELREKRETLIDALDPSLLEAPAAYWRPALAEALSDREGELVVDMRSAAYSTMWKPKRATLLAVRAFTESDSERKAVSHMAKAVRGDVARVLLQAKKPPADSKAAAALAESAGFTVDINDGNLDVIV